LGRVLATWTGRSRVLVDLEGHGREDLFDRVDLSRTVGWFTTIFPISLDIPEQSDLGGLLKSVKEQLRAVPKRGVGYGALRYLTAQGLADSPSPQISFNYLGQFDWSTGVDGSLFCALRGGLDADISPESSRTHVLDVVGRVEHRCLQFTWSFSEHLHHESTVSGLAAELLAVLRNIVNHCVQPGVGGRTPSDFPLVRLDQAAVDQLVGDGRSIEDIYPLTPMQAGMVVHGLSQRDQGAYFEQATFVLDGVDDSRVLAAAWQQVVNRIPTLRSRVVWEGVDEPLQVVQREVTVPITFLDWRHFSEAVRQEQLGRLLDRDRARGLDLVTAPLLRVALARLSGTEVLVIWTFHHVLLDGWSVYRVFSDLFACHAALAAGRQPEPVTRRPFREYLQWLSDRDHAGAKAYWRRALAGFEFPTALPYDRAPAQPHNARSDQSLSVDLDEAQSYRLDKFAMRHRLTLNAVLQGAWALVLSRYSGQRDVCFGATVSGRPADLPGADAIVGLFINTLPVRVQINETAGMVSWLQHLQTAQVEARKFDFTSLIEIHHLSDLPGGVRLFDSIMVFENYPLKDEATAAHGLQLRELQAFESTDYPLAVVVIPGRRLSIELGYDAALFDAATIEQLAKHLVCVLNAVTTNPTITAGKIDLLSQSERHRMLVDWNDTYRQVMQATLPELFQAQVVRAPDAPAVITAVTSLSYAELDARANRLAHRLMRLGIGTEYPVALLMEHSVDLVVAELAVVKAGGAYLPLDVRAPASRMRLLLAETAASVVLTDRRWEVRAREIHPREIILVDADPSLLDEPADQPEVQLHPDNLVYVMYTSGSTGAPKGVAIRHRDVVALAFDRRFTGGGHERVLFHSPVAFDASTYELWVPLLNGWQVVVAPPGGLDVNILRRAVAEHGVTGVFLTSGLFRMVAQESPECLAGAREVWTGGEIVPAAAIRRVLATCPGLVVVDVYGPTETTTYATQRGMSTADAVPDVVPIGRPMDNTRVYVLDAMFRPVPVGVAGELFITGAGLARGYVNQPGLTAERFVACPFGMPGSRMYRTGDIVRWTTEGELEFVGRTDEQIKIRGFRIELGEIEAALASHPGVAQVAVIAWEGEPGRKRLAAYVVPAASGTVPAPSELRTLAGELLPDYMVPSAFVVLDELPLNRNGKLDRKALPAPESGVVSGTGYVPPRTDAETVLAEIWSEVLGVEKVGIEDDFFELGGDSLRRLQLTSRIKAAFAITLTPRDVRTARTVSALAKLVEEKILSELERIAVSAGNVAER